MQAIFFVPLGLGVLLVIALLAAYVYALRRPSGEAVVYAATDFSSPAGFNVVSLPQDEILTRGQNLLWDSRLAELEFFAEPCCQGGFEPGGLEQQLRPAERGLCGPDPGDLPGKPRRLGHGPLDQERL